MRIRSIKPEFWRDPDSTGRWPLDLRCFYIGMWGVADDQGRFAWVPDLIAADLFPLDRSVDVDALLTRLEATGCAVRYEVDGRAYGWLPTFARHQKIDRPTKSRLPEPPEGLDEHSARIRRGLVAGSRDQGIRDRGSREGSGEPNSLPSASPPAPAEKPEKENGKPGTRLTALSKALEAVYLAARGTKYVHGGPKDTLALQKLLRAAGEAEIERRWRLALSLGSNWPGCSTFAQLGSKWNDLAAPANGRAAPVSAPDEFPDEQGIIADPFREGRHGNA